MTHCSPDIVQRLRDLQDHYSTSGQLGPENHHIFGDAADLIERLRGAAQSTCATPQEVQEACAKVADRFVERDLAWAKSHPHSASSSNHRAERGRAIAGAIRALIPPTSLSSTHRGEEG